MSVSTYIAGAAQASFRDDDSDAHPAELMARIALAALDDAGIEADRVDAIACVEPLSWTYDDLGAAVAADIGCGASLRQFWVPAGGTSPQDLLHQISETVADGELDCAVIAGAEAMRTRRRAIREGRELPWPPRPDDVSPIRGQRPFSSPLEQRHGLVMPVQAFPLFENAIRAAEHRGADEQVALAATLLAKNARVAADNPHAWFRDAPTADEIATVTPDNRLIAYPYTKRMNAIMDVNQAAAIILVSHRLLEELDLGQRAAAVLGGSGAEDPWFLTERNTFSESPAMSLAIGNALAEAGVSVDQLDAMDLYSCFPSAVELGLIALGIEPEDPRAFSLTGGLAFAGGPGNAYVLHSLATAVARLRSAPDERLLITGIGMSNTKHAATVVAGARAALAAGASGTTHYREETGIAPAPTSDAAEGAAHILSYTIEYDRSGSPSNVIYMLELPDGAHTVANAVDVATAARQLLASDPVGKPGTIVRNDGRHEFTLTD